MSSNPKKRAAHDNAAATLAELVAPLTEAQFLTHLRERTLAHVRSANPGGYSQLFSWEALRHLIQQGGYPRKDYFRVLKESEAAPSERWLVGGKIDLVRLEECLRDGFSLIINHLEEHLPALEALMPASPARICSRISLPTPSSRPAPRAHSGCTTISRT